MKKCSNRKCNNYLQDDAMYCGVCGTKWIPHKKKRFRAMLWILAAIMVVGVGSGAYFVLSYIQSAQTKSEAITVGTTETEEPTTSSENFGVILETARVDSENQERQRQISRAEELYTDGKWRASLEVLQSIMPQDAMLKSQRLECNKVFSRMGTAMFAAGKYNTAFLSSDYGVSVLGDNQYKEKEANKWRDIGCISLGDRHIVGLKLDGSVVAAGDNSLGQCNVGKWEDIAMISAGDVHTVALTHSGHLLATGYNDKGQCNVEQLETAANGREIIGIAAGYRHTLALLEDGTVVACGDESCYKGVEFWSNIAAVYANTTFSAGLTVDGRVLIEGKTKSGQDASYIWGGEWWPKIDMLALGDYFLVAVTEDGKVISAGLEDQGLAEALQRWEDIWMIAAGNDHVVGLTSRGYVLSVGTRHEDLLEVYGYALSDSPAVTGPEYEDITVSYSDIHTDEGNVWTLISGINIDGTVLWQYKTKVYGPSQILPVSEIVSGKEKYYFIEDDVVKALDKITGELVWENFNFDGGAPCGYEDANGRLYLSGFLGPDLFVIDNSGKTLHCIEAFSDFLYYWPHRIEKQGDYIAVIMDMGPEEQANPSEYDFVFLVDPVTYEYRYAGTIPEKE